MPKIPDLEMHVRDFLINGKKFLVFAYRSLTIFHQLPMNGRNEAYFDKHRDWIKKKLGEEHPIYKILASDEAWVRMIAECSNAVRHEEKGLKVEVETFPLKPGNKIASPGWRYDLTKKGLERQEHCSDLIHDLEVLMNNMLAFFENILLVCIQNKLKNNNATSKFSGYQTKK